MYSHKRTDLPKNTIQFTIAVPWEDVQTEYDKSFEALSKDLEVEGFRKGKAPKHIAEKNIVKDVVYEHLLRSYIPRVYTEILKEENVKPIIAPKVELTKAKENESWEIRLTTAITPDVTLGKYKEKVIKAKQEVQKSDIWVPGKDKEPSKDQQEKQKQAEFQAALNALMDEATAEVSDLIIEEEMTSRLSRLVDDIQRVGLTMESYLKSKELTKEQLNAQMRKEIEDTYKTEFILQKIAEEESITVEQNELDKILENVKDVKEKEAAKQNMYYYASLMRKQKTLDYISSL